MATEQRLDNIDTRLERLVAVAVHQQQETRELKQSIQDLRQIVQEQGKVLASGIAALTEQMTEFKITTQAQAKTTDRLVRIVEQLVTRQ